MKYTVLSIVAAAAPVTMGALISSAPEQTQSQVGLFDYFAPASSQPTVSAQCEGDGECQADVGASAAPKSDTGVRALVRDFMAPQQENAEPNHVVIYNTPVFEMLYNFMGLEDEAAPESATVEPASVSEEPTHVNRFVEAQSSSIGLDSNDHVQEDEDAPVFDFNSWGERVDNAAHRLVSNVGNVVINFLSESEISRATPTPAPENEDINEENEVGSSYAEQSESSAIAGGSFLWF
ncbi:hypothetical protein GGI15_002095 [Coemansia interrupta]|uniref:Uncharacterized protein n=1 Tax=Coemansia interrupta TaxID=1126814 RepID=A0A9W8HK00_9FUNG|nr:hypothetical protein GGI15_002095 [Coemansia interrupta]